MHQMDYKTNNPFILELTHDSPSYAQLIPEGSGEVLYSVSTEYPHGGQPLTRVVKGKDGKFVASLRWRPALPDLVVFGDETSKPMKISNWMKSGVLKGQ